MKIKKNIQEISQICKSIRRQILTMTTTAGSGHVTSSLSAVEIMATLLFGGFFEHPNYHELKDLESTELNKKLNEIGCDRFIFSKGHASPLFYSLYAQVGVLNDQDLNGFRRFESNLEGHPTPRFAWTEATTGSLGQGLGIGIGLALGIGKFGNKKLENKGLKIQSKNYKNNNLGQKSAFENNLESQFLQNNLDLINESSAKIGVKLEENIAGNIAENLENSKKIPTVFVLLGDSEMAEGSVWEALNSASFWQVSNLVAIVDLNRLGQTGQTQIGWQSDNLKRKLEIFGSLVWETDGHNIEQITSIYQEVCNCKEAKPKIIIAKNVKGKGVSFLENAENWHGKALDKNQLELALKEII